jgi:hypothetical protein
MKRLVLIVAMSLSFFAAFAQCPFDTTVTTNPDLSENNILCAGSTLTFTAPAGYDSYQWKYKFSASGAATNFDGETSNVLSIDPGDLGFAYVFVTITDDDCTEDSDDHMFDTWIFLLPAIEHEPVTNFCYGESTIISNAFPGPTQFRWFQNGALVYEGPQDFYEVTESGAYLLSVSYPDCPDTWLSSGVPVNITFVGEEVTIEEIDGTLYTVEGGSLYSWYLNGELIPDADAYFYTPEVNGTYTVDVTFQQGVTCLISSEDYEYSGLTLGDNVFTNAVFFNNTIAKNQQFVISNSLSKEVSLQVFDLNGKKVFETSANTQQIYINAEIWKNGLYLCRITVGNETQVVKLSK